MKNYKIDSATRDLLMIILVSLVLVFLFIIGLPKCSAQGCLKLDIILLVDVSSSVEKNVDFISNATTSFNKRFENGNVNIGLITFSGDAQIKYHLGEQKIITIGCYGGTNLVLGLQACLDEFKDYGREGYKKLIILISDGDADEKDNSIIQANLLKSVGIQIIGIGIESSSLREDFMKILCDSYVESNYELLEEELMKLDICL